MSKSSLLDSRIIKYAYRDTEEVFRDIGTSPDGLSEEQADEMRATYGKNVFAVSRSFALWQGVRRAFINPFTIVLFVLAVVSIFTDVVFVSDEYSRKPTTAAVIFIMILISGIIRLIQELKAKSAAEQLDRLIRENVTVKRNGKWTLLPAEELVAGDIISISAGDRIPADIRLTKVDDLFISQAAITGESEILEKSALDFYMLDHVCKDIKGWLDEGRPVVKVSVNLSRRHLGDMDLLDKIINIIDSNGVPHEYIEIELTETTTEVDFKDLKEIVTGLQSHGISTSVDDFGMGYSSLNLIRELPWDVLKLDKSFIDDETAEKNTHSRTMLKHTIAMAHEIGMESIVEGVETAEQVQLLKDNNCFLAQGFFFDKPLPKSEFEKRLDSLR